MCGIPYPLFLAKQINITYSAPLACANDEKYLLFGFSTFEFYPCFFSSKLEGKSKNFRLKKSSFDFFV
jgi:hypothetical protein